MSIVNYIIESGTSQKMPCGSEYVAIESSSNLIDKYLLNDASNALLPKFRQIPRVAENHLFEIQNMISGRRNWKTNSKYYKFVVDGKLYEISSKMMPRYAKAISNQNRCVIRMSKDGLLKMQFIKIFDESLKDEHQKSSISN